MSVFSNLISVVKDNSVKIMSGITRVDTVLQ